MSDTQDRGPAGCWKTTYQPIPPERPSRRERIATAALQGLLASTAEGHNDRLEPYALALLPKSAASLAAQHADALIAELDKEEE